MSKRKLLYSPTYFGIMPPPIKAVSGKTFDLVYTHMYNTSMNVHETLSLRVLCNFLIYIWYNIEYYVLFSRLDFSLKLEKKIETAYYYHYTPLNNILATVLKTCYFIANKSLYTLVSWRIEQKTCRLTV